MTNDPVLTYEISWRTCRNKPIVQGETKKLLYELLAQIAQERRLTLDMVWVEDDGRLVGVRVSTSDPELSPNSIAYMLRHKTGGIIRQRIPELQKLPAIWTSKYDVATVMRPITQ